MIGRGGVREYWQRAGASQKYEYGYIFYVRYLRCIFQSKRNEYHAVLANAELESSPIKGQE